MREFLQHTTKNRPELASSKQRVQVRDLEKYIPSPELQEEIINPLIGDGNIPDVLAWLIPCQPYA